MLAFGKPTSLQILLAIGCAVVVQGCAPKRTPDGRLDEPFQLTTVEDVRRARAEQDSVSPTRGPNSRWDFVAQLELGRSAYVDLVFAITNRTEQPVDLWFDELPSSRNWGEFLVLQRDSHTLNLTGGIALINRESPTVEVKAGESHVESIALADTVDSRLIAQLGSGRYDLMGVLTFEQLGPPSTVIFPVRLLSFDFSADIPMRLKLLPRTADEQFNRELEMIPSLSPPFGLEFLLALDPTEAAKFLAALDTPTAKKIMAAAKLSRQKEGLAELVKLLPTPDQERLTAD